MTDCSRFRAAMPDAPVRKPMTAGGHFAALEQPRTLATGIRASVKGRR
jgi:hypothetical protein